MNKSISYTEKLTTAYNLIDLGYRDYIAARFLLNNHFVIQGLTLASTAVEKYLKSLIVLTSKEEVKYYYHLDNLKKLKNILSKNNIDITNKFDPVFLNVLEKAFKIRYYDKINEPITIAIFINQFIGELDYTIDFMETFVLNTQNSITPYRTAIKEKDRHLYKNNYILNKENKKDFMEKPDEGFSIQISTSSALHTEKTIKSKGIINKYEGKISIFKDFQSDWSDLNYQ